VDLVIAWSERFTLEMECKLLERLRPPQYSIVLRAEKTAPMKCSVTRLASGPPASANHLNQTASRRYRCDGDLDSAACPPNDSTMGWMAINRGEACSSSHCQPHNHSSLGRCSESTTAYTQKNTLPKDETLLEKVPNAERDLQGFSLFFNLAQWDGWVSLWLS
jgi:hypothetical protein